MEIVAVNEQKIHGRFSNIYRLIRLQLKSTVFKHMLAWCIYIIYAYLTNLIATPDENFLDIVFANMLSIWSFYAGYFSLLVSFDRKRPLTAVLLWLVGLGILFVLRYVYAYILLDMLGLKPYTTDRFQVIIRDSIISYVRFFIYSAGFYYARKSVLKERELRKAEEEKHYLEEERLRLEKMNLQSEYAFLRSQINPHFLHNTLNFFYAKSLGCSKELSESILVLCEIMRYSLENEEDHTGTVLLSKEVEHLQNVIKINQIRFSNRLQVDFSISGDTTPIRIIPLVLITLIENAFKHGELTSKDHPLVIKLSVDNEQQSLRFQTHNKKKAGPKELSHGIGMDNIRKRLSAAYKNSYTLNVKDEAGFYTVDLYIDLAAINP